MSKVNFDIKKSNKITICMNKRFASITKTRNNHFVSIFEKKLVIKISQYLLLIRFVIIYGYLNIHLSIKQKIIKKKNSKSYFFK